MLKEILAALARSRQAYSQWRARAQRRRRRTANVLAAVRRLRALLPRLGVRKLCHLLRGWGTAFALGRDGLFALLRGQGLLVRPTRRFVHTTRGRKRARYANLCARAAPQPEQLWVADITYLRLGSRFRYLALVLDRHSRFILGYQLAKAMPAALVVAALEKALALRRSQGPIIHHSDRGSQYDSAAFAAALARHGLTGSMCQRADPYENAHAERVMGILKHELGLWQSFRCEQHLRASVDTAIHRYNFLRPHMALQMRTPAQVHLAHSSLP